MNRILVPASTGALVRNFLRAGFIAEAQRVNLSLVFVVSQEKIDAYQKEFGAHGIFFEIAPRQDFAFLESIIKTGEKWSVHTYFILLHHLFFLKRRGSQDAFLVRIALFLVRMFLWFLGGFSLFRRVARFTYSLLPAPSARAFLKAHQPTLVFCPSLLYGVEWQLVKEARRLSITTVGMVASWDNFYSKTFLRVFPDYLFVQNKLLKKQAIVLADYPECRIRVVGAPQYDRHWRREGVVSRSEFMKRIGADPSKKLILYAFSGKISEAVDNEMLAVLHRLLDESGLRNTTQVLVRPYPKRNFSPQKAQWARQSLGFLVEESSTKIGDGKDKWELDEEALRFMANSLAHADIVVTACSTFFVEAAIFGVPLIGISFDGGLTLDAVNSARRFRQWEHIADLERTGGVWFVENEAEFLRALQSYVSSRELHADGRRKIVEEQLSGLGGGATRTIAEELQKIIISL